MHNFQAMLLNFWVTLSIAKLHRHRVSNTSRTKPTIKNGASGKKKM